MVKNKRKKIIVLGIILIFLYPSIASGVENTVFITDKKPIISEKISVEETNSIPVTITFYGKTKTNPQTTAVSDEDIDNIFNLFKELKLSIVSNPFDNRTQELKEQFLTLLSQWNLIPASISPDQYSTLLNPPWFEKLRKNHNSMASSPVRINAEAGAASAVVCSLAGEGIGVLFPFLMLPRPRIINGWSALDGNTVVGKLLTIGGFAAGGAQFGISLGFWGIGLAYATPYGTFYGFIGYSLFTMVTAQVVERYPPDYPPAIIGINPADGEQNVPESLSELSFSIEDPSGDLMSYTVATHPDIGSGTGNLKPAGTYSVPIHGLEGLTQYNWTLQVSDDVQTIEQTFTFTTAAVAPIISNPSPENGEQDVPMNIPSIQFTLKDYQGDAMDYTVETSPNIGSQQQSDVYDGTYTVPISGMIFGGVYHWFVNVTDGTHWTKKDYSFSTGYPSPFDPFDYGWLYRKQIIIDHTKVTGNLSDFPMFIDIIDSDLQIKAQPDGDDILFMDGSGAAERLNHEIETYNAATGELSAWINIPRLSTSADTIFYMYYGNSNCSTQQRIEKTWNDNFMAVWHLQNDPIQTIKDSTQNHNDGISHGAMSTSDVIDGMTGNCLDFDGVDDYISVPDSTSLKPTDLTLVAWFKPHSVIFGNFLVKQGDDYWGNSDGRSYGFWYLSGTNTIRGEFEIDAYAQEDNIGSYPIEINTWSYLALTFNKATHEGIFYVNGALNGIKNPCHDTVLWYEDPWDFNIAGSQVAGGSPHVVDNFHNCALDEIRIVNSPLSLEWISTEYNNQNNPSGFSSLGFEESHP